MTNTLLGKIMKWFFYFCLCVFFLMSVTPTAPSWPFFLLLGGFLGYSICDAQWKKGSAEEEDGIETDSEKKRVKRTSKKKFKDSKDLNLSESELQSMRANINKAISGGEVIKIKYWGGSNPGEMREIAPVKMKDDLIVMAVCQQSNSMKSFRIDRIESDQFDEAA